MLSKRYIIKIYSLDGTFVRTLDPNLLMNEVSFTDKIGGGQGQCVLELNVPLDDFDEGTIVAHMNVLKIYESDRTYSPTPRLIYTGFVSQYTPFVNNGREGVRVTLLGLVSFLSLGYFTSGGSYAFNKTDDPAEIMKDVIDAFAAVYTGGWISYAGGFITTVGTTVNYDFDKVKWLDALKKMAEFADADWWWHIGADGEVYLQDRPAAATHLLTIGKDVEELEIGKNNEKIVNKYRLTYNTPPATLTFQDATSQAAYGIREKVETDSNTKDATSANQKGDKMIADFKDPKVETRLKVNNNYDIESIKPGDTVTIRNTKAGSNVLPGNLLVTAVSYTPSGVALTLENQIPSLADTFVAAVEAVG